LLQNRKTIFIPYTIEEIARKEIPKKCYMQ
jgi:hypothetical protein